MINQIFGHHHFSSKPYATICHLVCAMWMPRVVAAVITKALPGGEAYFWCFILMIRCWVLFFLQVTQLVGGLEPWNFEWLSIYWECHHPKWRHILFRGVETTNQTRPWRPFTNFCIYRCTWFSFRFIRACFFPQKERLFLPGLRRSSGNLYSAVVQTPQFGSLKSHCNYSTWCVQTSIFGG